MGITPLPRPRHTWDNWDETRRPTMKTTIATAAAIAILATPQISRAQTPPTIHGPIALVVDAYASEYGVSPSLLQSVVACESSGDPSSVGDHGTSFGLAQIHLPAHPELTRGLALDPYFAASYIARQIADGNGWMWTCYRDMWI